jgi:hypothetical protein
VCAYYGRGEPHFEQPKQDEQLVPGHFLIIGLDILQIINCWSLLWQSAKFDA